MGRPTNAELAARRGPELAERQVGVGKLRDLSGNLVEGKKYRVTIYGDPNDKGPVDLAVNGFNIRIKRDEEVIIGEAYLNVLKNAVIETMQWNQDTNTSSISRRMVYPFQATEVVEAA